MIDDTLDKIRAAASNGLTKQETAALIGTKLTEEQLIEYDRVKGIMKLKSKQEEREAEARKKEQGISKLKEIYHKPAVLDPIPKRYTKEQFIAEIEANYGIVTLLCAKLDCTAKQFYKAIDHWKLRDFLKDCKKSLVGLAEKAILDCLMSADESIRLRAAVTTLKSLGKDEWNESPQVQIAQQINVTDKETVIKDIFGIDTGQI